MQEPTTGQGLCKALEETGTASELTMNGVGNSEVILRQEQLTVLGHLVRARHSFKCFTWTGSFDPHKNTMRCI